MGCIYSKSLSAGDLHVFSGNKGPISGTDDGDLPTHSVFLTSSTYGVLNLDPFENQKSVAFSPNEFPILFPESKKTSFVDRSPEIINWVLVEDPQDAGTPHCSPQKKTTKRPPAVLSPSPKIQGKFIGKENRTPRPRTPVTDHNRVLKTLIFSENKKSGSRRSSSPLFDPELVASFEQELDSESEQIKKMVSPRNWKKEDRSSSFLFSFEENCPPGGENAVVLYTTSLRGIRKTYEDCNLVRSVIESYNVYVIERDVSMDLGFREELRKLLGGTKEVKMPVLFVKGRMVGGADEVLKLDEERKLEILMEGVPKAVMSCSECGGLRFVMCKECNGSCKVLDEGEKKKKCGFCNENGLVYCFSCSK
ncbi:uncharacterized protein At3g28850 [Dendrobium catenatum]|uniref:Glutaredoxin domain-containing protein n=1 Tax=Dendrobium catenatum TaxID=906689 RepID=A0A2I0W4Y0_9ASPA|nr:uncharacterized protein At3g28850 [Dendrobium catenatum]PKU70708.1 Uncharacterized protein MA16_Dca016906 [Dendrobium catenatum]